MGTQKYQLRTMTDFIYLFAFALVHKVARVIIENMSNGNMMILDIFANKSKMTPINYLTDLQ